MNVMAGSLQLPPWSEGKERLRRGHRTGNNFPMNIKPHLALSSSNPKPASINNDWILVDSNSTQPKSQRLLIFRVSSQRVKMPQLSAPATVSIASLALVITLHTPF